MKQEKRPHKLTNYPVLEGPLNTIGMYNADPMGSYTGRPADAEETPVQDADDL